MRSAISAAVGTVCLVSAVAAAPTAFATPTLVQRTFAIRVTPASFAESAPGSFAEGVRVTQTAFAGSAPAAYAKPYWPVDCGSANVRKSYSTSSSVVGVAYRGDIDHISKGLYKESEHTYTWWYGTVTRKSDDHRVTGWISADCINARV